MSLSIGQRVRLNVKKDAQYPSDTLYNGQIGTIESIIPNPWFPVLVLIDGREHARYFREDEVEPIGEGEDA